MNTPEIQARIERIDRVISVLKTVPNMGMVGANETARVAILELCALRSEVQVPAEAKEEGEPQVPEELYDGHAVLGALSDWAKPRTSAENVSDVLDAAVRLIKRRIKERPASDPGLDYERLFEVLPEAWGCYSMDESGCVFAHQKKAYISEDEWVDGGAMCRIPEFLLRNLPADWTQSLRVREPKPEPDVEPDENTPRLTEVEFKRSWPNGEWERGHLLKTVQNSEHCGYVVLAKDNCVLSVVCCRLRREGK